VTQPKDYELVLTPPAQRAIAEKLPESVAAAVIDFLTTALIENPQRVGKPLRDDLAGIWSARRGTYRVLYRIGEQSKRSLSSASSIAVMPTDLSKDISPRNTRTDLSQPTRSRNSRERCTTSAAASASYDGSELSVNRCRSPG